MNVNAFVCATALTLYLLPAVASAQRYEGGFERRGFERHEGGERREGFERRERFEGHRFEGGGHERRFWHGRWWPYGVGSCWRWTPVGYVWICGD